MKVVFLDIDGVLNKENWMLNKTPWIEDEKISLIGKLCKKTGAKVVLSTNWRDVWYEPMYYKNKDNGIHFAHKLFKKYGIKVIGTTPVMGSREIEILLTLENLDIKEYVVIDDTNLNSPNFIHTDKKVGFTQSDYEKALSILNT